MLDKMLDREAADREAADKEAADRVAPERALTVYRVALKGEETSRRKQRI